MSMTLTEWAKKYRRDSSEYNGVVARLFVETAKYLEQMNQPIVSAEALLIEIFSSGLVSIRLDDKAEKDVFFSDNGRENSILYSIGAAMYHALFGTPDNNLIPAWKLCPANRLYGLTDIIIDIQDPLSCSPIRSFSELIKRLSKCMKRLDCSSEQMGKYHTQQGINLKKDQIGEFSRTVMAAREFHSKVHVGIDFGSSNCYACVLDDNGKVFSIPLDCDSEVLKSIIFYKTPDVIVIGREALSLAQKWPAGLYRDFKRNIGDNSSARQIVCENGEVIWVASDNATQLLLNEIGKRIRNYFSSQEVHAVVTTPAEFISNGKSGLIGRIARESGFDSVITRVEPYAAAVAYDRYHCLKDEEQCVFVFDFGGGTLDFACVRFSPSRNEIISMGGDEKLGGADITQIIANKLTEKVFERLSADICDFEKSGLDIEKYRSNMERIWWIAENFKLRFSDPDCSFVSNDIELYLPTFFDSYKTTVELSLNRNEYVALLQPILNRINSCMEDFFSHSSVRINDIRLIAFAGGSCNIPEVRRCVSDFFADSVADIPESDYLSKELDLLIASGAAILSGDRTDSVAAANEITAHSERLIMRTQDDYGIQVDSPVFPGGEFKMIIPKNTVLPCSGLAYIYMLPGESEVNVRVFSRSWRNPHSKRINFDKGFSPVGTVKIQSFGNNNALESLKVCFFIDKSMIINVRAELFSDSCRVDRKSETFTVKIEY